jgi:hypothetical protein
MVSDINCIRTTYPMHGTAYEGSDASLVEADEGVRS